MIIIGAGLAGTLAGTLLPNAQIFESGLNRTNHQALLRFRTPDIGEAVGIPFKKVRVYKSIWDLCHQPLTPKYVSQYSHKVTGRYAERSITNIDTVDRWVAPINFLEQLKDQLGNRVQYEHPITDRWLKECISASVPIISTIPIDVLAGRLDFPVLGTDFHSSKIWITSYGIEDCDLFMSVYFPDPKLNIYRASLTGNVLTLEGMHPMGIDDEEEAIAAFGLKSASMSPILENHEQSNGKISDVDEARRRQLIVDMTIKYGIFSLGRFATWRNLLLDDVYKDIAVIKRLINKDHYSIVRHVE